MSNIAENEGKWYVIHTYSGYENKVLDSINKMVINMGLQDYIFDVKIPVEEVMEVKNERRKVVQHKLFPSYVMIKMIMTKRTMYLIRNTRGVTGFVGPQGKAVALTEEEIKKAIRRGTLTGKFFPVICGSSYKNKGVQELLNAIDAGSYLQAMTCLKELIRMGVPEVIQCQRRC